MAKQCWKCKKYWPEFWECPQCGFSACSDCWHYSSLCPECKRAVKPEKKRE